MQEKKIIWTRAVDDWPADIEVFGANLEHVLHLPCIRTQATIQPTIPYIPPNQSIVVIFASAKAVQYSLANPVLVAILHRAGRILAFGGKTAATLQKHGFRVETTSRWRSMNDLAKDLLASISGDELVLAPGPTIRSLDLTELLDKQGIEFVSVDIYETCSGLRGKEDELLLESDIDKYQRELSGVVCFASPSAVLGFTKWLDLGQHGLGERLQAVCIGETTQRVALEHFDACWMSPQQSTESIFATALSYRVLIKSS